MLACKMGCGYKCLTNQLVFNREKSGLNVLFITNLRLYAKNMEYPIKVNINTTKNQPILDFFDTN